MRYWYDTEFLETGPKNPLQLVSIGIVAEDGREYYAQSVEFDPVLANGWVREHVLSQLTACGSPSGKWEYDKSLYSWEPCEQPGCPWRQLSDIANEIRTFMGPEQYGMPELWGYYSAYDHVVFCQLFGTMMDLPKGFPMYTRDIKQWCDELGNPRLPEQGKGEHNALADARWNKVAWEFLKARQLANTRPK